MTGIMTMDTSSIYNPFERFTNISSYAPDDTFKEWVHPFHWSQSAINQLVMDEVGKDIIFPRGYMVLIKLWSPPQVSEGGLDLTDHAVKKGLIQTSVGKVLRMGGDAFTDSHRFPSGPLVTYGEWAIFRSQERQVIGVNGHRLALIADDRWMGFTSDPDEVITAYELEHEWANN